MYCACLLSNFLTHFRRAMTVTQSSSRAIIDMWLRESKKLACHTDKIMVVYIVNKKINVEYFAYFLPLNILLCNVHRK